MAITIATARRLRLSTSSNFSTWTHYPEAIVREVTWGTAMAPGAASADVPWGNKVLIGSTVVAQAAPLVQNLAALWSRIEEETAPDTWTPQWWGRVSGAQIEPYLGGSGKTSLQLEDLHGLLGKRLVLGAQVAKVGGGLIDLHRWPVVGQNRSASPVTVNGASVYVPVLSPAVGEWWTAQQLIESIIAHVWPSGWPALSLAGQASALLGYRVTGLDLNGQTLAGVINGLVGPDRGATYRLDVTGSAIQAVVRSLLRDPITAGSVTWPASTEQASLDLDADNVLTAGASEDWADFADEVLAETVEPGQVGLTLKWLPDGSGSLVKGWDPAGEAAVLTRPPNVLTSDELNPVWHRLVIRDDWDGMSDTGAGGLRHVLATSGGAYTGARSSGATPVGGVVLDASLPYPAGQAPSSDFGAVDLRQTQQQAVVIVEWTTGVFEDVSSTMRVRVGGPGEIFLGDGAHDAHRVHLWLTSAAAVYISLTAHEWAPTTVSALAASPVSGTQRLMRLPVVEARLVQGLLTSVSPTEGAQRLAADGVIASQVDELSTMVAAMAAQQQPQASLTFKKEGLHTSHEPASMLDPITGAGLNGAAALCVFSRTWRQEGHAWVTVWAARTVPAFGGIS